MLHRLRLTATFLISSTLLLSVHTQALEAISDQEMGGITGQAFITIDTSNYSDTTYGDYEFSKVNLGVDIEIMANADSIKLGTFERQFGSEGTAPVVDVTFDSNGNRIVEYITDESGQVAVRDSDLHLDNFALGRVDDAFGDNPTLVPFNIHNPYLELAYAVDDNGVRRIAGVRIGAESAYGNLSADLISLTGAFEGKVIGTAAVAYQNACVDSDTGNWFDCLALAIAGDTLIESELDLLDGATGNAIPADSDGQIRALYIKRAQWAGIQNGDYFTTTDPDNGLRGIIELLAVADDCKASGVVTCFPISIYDSIYIGVDDANESDDNFTDNGARGLFVSLQSEVVPWKDFSGLPDADRIYAEHGAYLNSAKYMTADGAVKYPLVLDLYEGLTGVQRVNTCVGRTKGC